MYYYVYKKQSDASLSQYVGFKIYEKELIREYFKTVSTHSVTCSHKSVKCLV